MDRPEILPPIGLPVSTNIVDLQAADDASIGEIIHAATTLSKLASDRMADPATFYELATFTQSGGADWSGLQGRKQVTDETEGNCNDAVVPPPTPTPPENYCDTLPAIGTMFTQLTRTHDVMMANYAGMVESVMRDQIKYLGATHAETSFRDGRQYLRDTMKLSSHVAQRHLDRAASFTTRPSTNPQQQTTQPIFPRLAESFAAGRLPDENADRLVGMDKDLIKYAKESGKTTEFKDHIMHAFEHGLVEAGEAASPEELSQQKRRWMDRIAHEISPDGPSPAQVLAKQADNALKTRGQPDGSGRIWMDATPEVYAKFKNFILHQSNFNGKASVISPELAELLNTDTTPDLNSAVPVDNPAEIVGEDSDGRPVSAGYMALVDSMTHGQKLGAILIGMLNTILSMDPAEIGIKKSHGASAQLVVVQDIETAYKTLGYQPLPPDAQRPPGPDGVSPPVIKRPNPDRQETPNRDDPGRDFDEHVSSVPWTPFESEVINSGPIHPADAQILACNAEIVAQIRNGPDIVLRQQRTQRLFTPGQRRAILTRDRGCQAPGCTVPAAYCDIHHIVAWHTGGYTDETNAITLCSRHHTAVHLGKWTIRKAGGLTFLQPAPWLDPSQPLLRNAYWNV
ncbi:MAG: HNH endonuclease [Yaniella sp.]|nr:HNH endonuclease [Yaniella sp.]